MLLARILHVLGNIFWLGGGAACAFAAALMAGESKEVRLASARALRAITVYVVTPGMLVGFGAGLAMLVPQWAELYARQPWMHMKLTVGLVAMAFSGVLTGKLRKAALGEADGSARALKLAGAALALSALAAVVLVFARPGAR